MKSIGLILLFLSSTVLGIYTARCKRKALNLYRRTNRMLCEIKSILRYNQPNRTELIETLRDMGYGDCLNKLSDNQIISDYFSKLGTRDLQSELDCVDQCIDQYKIIVNEVERNTIEGCKMSVGAGVLVGTFLVVILI